MRWPRVLRTLATSRTSNNALHNGAKHAQSSALNLNQSNITINFTFAGSGSSCCPGVGSCPTNGGLKQGDSATLKATYPCFLKVPIIGFKTFDVCPAGRRPH